MQELVSIIVPVYKVEEYLPRCVDSLLKQTYKNIEIILVDDGSPDGCGKLCDDYAARDSRVKVIHKKNGGLSDARNVAIPKACGEYIVFVDSDDWVSKYYVGHLYEAIKKTMLIWRLVGLKMFIKTIKTMMKNNPTLKDMNA